MRSTRRERRKVIAYKARRYNEERSTSDVFLWVARSQENFGGAQYYTGKGENYEHSKDIHPPSQAEQTAGIADSAARREHSGVCPDRRGHHPGRGLSDWRSG